MDLAIRIKQEEEETIEAIENELHRLENGNNNNIGNNSKIAVKSKDQPKKKRKKWAKCKKEVQPLTCSECGAQFDYRCYLDIHMRKHMAKHQYPCQECGEIFPLKVYLHEHIRTHDMRPYKCELCGTSFTAKSSLQLHMVMHSGIKRFKCEHCGEQFVRKALLQKHLLYHTGEKPFQCENCDKKFISKQALYQHIRSHMKERPFKCSECDFSFGRRESLQKHSRLHTGEKPFNCDECQTKFARKQTLLQHLSTHNNVTPYKCVECDAEFQRKFALRKHIARNHSLSRKARGVTRDYKATYSTFTPTNQSGPYSCQECKRNFASDEAYQEHNMGKCSLCWSMFGSLDNLHKHVCPNEENGNGAEVVAVTVEAQNEEHLVQSENDDEQHIGFQVEDKIYWCSVPKGINPNTVHIIMSVKEDTADDAIILP